MTLRGQAQDAGALGDTISVQNVQSKRLVQGVVSGPGRVTVTATPARFVGAEPPPASESSPSDQPQREHSVE